MCALNANMKKALFFILILPLLTKAQMKHNFSFEAGIGCDVQRFSPKYNRPWNMKAISFLTEEKLPIYLTPPIYVGAKYQRKMSKRWQFETGLDVYYRQLWVQRSTVNQNGKIHNTEVRFIPLFLPFDFSYKRKIGKYNYIATLGFSFEFTRLFHIDQYSYFGGPASLEPKGAAKVIEITEGEYRMFYLNNSGGILNLEATVEVMLGKRKSLKLQFRNQLVDNVYQLQVWGYDKANNTREGGYFPTTFSFKTITIGYRHYLRDTY